MLEKSKKNLMKKSCKNIVRALILNFLVVLNVNAASFELVPDSAEFLAGCESAVDILIDTSGTQTNVGEAIIEYDADAFELVDQNGFFPGKQVRGGNLYETYLTFLDEEAGIIKILGYSSMSSYSGSDDIFATLIFKPRSNVSGFDMDFDFTNGGISDSNLINLQNDDILTSVSGGSYTISTGLCEGDNIPPRVPSFSPSDKATGVALDSNLIIDITDNASGVDLDTVEFKVNQSNFSIESSAVSYEEITNGYQFTIDPLNDFSPGVPVFVEIDAVDNYGNIMTTKRFSFNHPLIDNLAPRVRNPLPTPGSKDVHLDALISFKIEDDIAGVDLNSLNVLVDGVEYDIDSPEMEVSGDPLEYQVIIDPAEDFPEFAPIEVIVAVADLDDNVMTPDFRYVFNEPDVDNRAPRIQSTDPENDERLVPLDQSFSFVITDNLSGVDIDTVTVEMLGEQYDVNDAQFSYSGERLNYEVTINPQNDYPANEEVSVTINARDLVGNTMSPYSTVFNRPAVCGDNIVEPEFGEQCEPAGTACCDSQCRLTENIEEICEELDLTAPGEEAICGNGIIEEGEDCESPGKNYCDNSCQFFESEIVGYQNYVSEFQGRDTDGDGVPDVIERSLGTAIDSADTDGDGISDYEEYLVYGTDPLVFTEEIPDDTRILNWKDGDRTASPTLLIRGRSVAEKRVEIFAYEEDKTEIFLGEAQVDEESNFILNSKVELESGIYLLQAKAYDGDSFIDESPLIRIEVDLSVSLASPDVKAISDVELTLDTNVRIKDQTPFVFGQTKNGAQVIAFFESSLTSSTIFADSLFGYFTIYSPRPLEPGPHKVSVYAIDEDGLRSDTIEIEFVIDEESLFSGGVNLWTLLLIITLIAAGIGVWYYYYKKRDEEKRMEEMVDIAGGEGPLKTANMSKEEIEREIDKSRNAMRKEDKKDKK